MDYPNYDEITDPRPTLPPEVVAALQPWFESAQRSYRAFRQRFRTDTSIWEEEPAIVIEHASDVFRVLVVRLIKDRRADIDEFRSAISLEVGAARTAFRYAHFLYRDVQGGRMLGLWHRDIRNQLRNLIKDAEDWWWNPKVVPNGWERFVGDSNVSLPAAQVEETSQPASGFAAQAPAEGSAGATEIVADEHADGECAPEREDQDPHALVAAFIERCFRETGFKPKKKMIWLAAGYTQRSDFDRWQGKKATATKTADENFRRILAMPPRVFLDLVKKQGRLR